MQALLNIAIRAARRGGNQIVRNMERVRDLDITTKGRNDFVTEVDRLAEREIITAIRKSYPDHAFLAEESGARGDSPFVWIIDPLDGTTNFLHGFPVFAVSIALQVRGQLEHAVVYDPLRQELFTASRGEGAQLDGRRIRVGNRRGVAGALIGTGFPYSNNLQYMDAYIAMFRDVADKAAGIRRPGAAALDLAYVAAGRYDAFWETGLKVWDMAAGTLIIREAGGIVSDLDGGDRFLESGHVLAGSPRVHAEMRTLLKPHLVDGLR